MMLSVSALLVVTACDSGSSADCVANDVGTVCAESVDGRIDVSGRGLEPGSEIRIDGLDDATFTLPVAADGTPGTVGFLYSFADGELSLTVSAVDSDGDPFTGDITVAT